jgi:hypothetical protein
MAGAADGVPPAVVSARPPPPQARPSVAAGARRGRGAGTPGRIGPPAGRPAAGPGPARRPAVLRLRRVEARRERGIVQVEGAGRLKAGRYGQRGQDEAGGEPARLGQGAGVVHLEVHAGPGLGLAQDPAGRLGPAAQVRPGRRDDGACAVEGPAMIGGRSRPGTGAGKKIDDRARAEEAPVAATIRDPT